MAGVFTSPNDIKISFTNKILEKILANEKEMIYTSLADEKIISFL